MKVYIYSSKSTVTLINGGEIFYIVMMTLGGSKAIITLRAADMDRGRWCGYQRSWEVIMWNDRRKWLVVTSSCPLTLQVAERGSWLIVVITCKTCLTSVNDPDHYIRVDYVGHPDVSWKLSGCFMLISVVWPSLRQAGYEGASCVSGWGDPDGMRATCHYEVCGTCSQEEGSLHLPLYVLLHMRGCTIIFAW